MEGQRIGRGKLNLRRMCDTERSLSSEKLQVQTQKISFCQLWWDYKLLLKRNDINAITIFLPSCVVVRKTAIFEDTQLKQSGPVQCPSLQSETITYPLGRSELFPPNQIKIFRSDIKIFSPVLIACRHIEDQCADNPVTLTGISFYSAI